MYVHCHSLFVFKLGVVMKRVIKMTKFTKQEKKNQNLIQIFYLFRSCHKHMQSLTLKAPRKKSSENVACWSRLLQIIA